ncbi:phospho-sugar mutase [Longivirga aurantiaca]|uniref:Phospho-sugar mutase n=1 Tax=Longivirga aurantiaca TaxID=1837743 RepID=A0ABW1SXP7_9ACTN
MSSGPTLVDRARAWLAEDPDPDTRHALDVLLDAAGSGDEAAAAELLDAFDGRLEFGTAGLRGALGPGPNRMNRAVVSRAAAGLAAYLVERGGGTVVVGYDARHKSDAFARDTAEVMEGAGLHAYVLPRPLPTPVLAYAIRHLGAAAGVMVTASHNPPQDNGYKVYLGDGTQIVPPADHEISACIDAVGDVRDLPRGDGWEHLDDSVLDAYLRDVAALVGPASPRDVAIAYTPMHGVGGDVMLQALAAAGFRAPSVVRAQFAPDPDFPTVSFPNPEEPGAMDLAIEEGLDADADVVIANDPDADRCAVAVPTQDRGAGGGPAYRMLRGDEVGWLLGWWLHERGAGGPYANSIVSSSLLSKMAAAYGIEHHETLTGFKWIGRIPGLAFGYEEALGYCVDSAHVADKDGVSAALRIIEMVAALKAEDRTVHDVLDDLAVAHGLHATDQLSVRVSDLSLIADAMARLRANRPTDVAGLEVEGFDDLEDGGGGLPPTDGVRLHLAQGTRVIVRPSGTEPKLKCYLEVVVPVTSDVEASRLVAQHRLAALKDGMAEVLGL